MTKSNVKNGVLTNIVLTGFMGTGKTTVGRILAERLNLTFVDTDQVLEDRHGPISEIFAQQGEDAFRDMERTLAQELSQRTNLLISTGGRMMLDSKNVEALSATSRIVCLVAEPKEILERVAGDDSRMKRPLLAVPDPLRRILELLGEREQGYGQFPQVITTGRTPPEVADLVEELVRPTTT